MLCVLWQEAFRRMQEAAPAGQGDVAVPFAVCCHPGLWVGPSRDACRPCCPGFCHGMLSLSRSSSHGCLRARARACVCVWLGTSGRYLHRCRGILPARMPVRPCRYTAPTRHDGAFACAARVCSSCRQGKSKHTEKKKSIPANSAMLAAPPPPKIARTPN